MSLIEFNIFINLFNKITEFDVRSDYTINKVKTFISKDLQLHVNNFIMYFGDIKLEYGVIGDYNIKENTMIHIYPKIKTGSNKLVDNNIKYDSMNDVKEYILNNININKNINNKEEDNIIIDKDDKEREEQNINTHNKLQELLKKINKKN